MLNITFTDTIGLPKEIKPCPASQMLPDWYKKTESYIGGKKIPIPNNNLTKSTIKKCMPVFDALTAGYLLPLPADIYVSIKEVEGQKLQWFEWAAFDLVLFHPIEQAPLHPLKKPHDYPKFVNPWAIKTAKGYSCLLVQPFHREITPFTILPAVVDTDKYISTIHFPFVLNDPNFTGLIPAGTPMVQVIPFKRENWVMSMGKEQDNVSQKSIGQLLKTKFFDGYKSLFWSKKEYK